MSHALHKADFAPWGYSAFAEHDATYRKRRHNPGVWDVEGFTAELHEHVVRAVGISARAITVHARGSKKGRSATFALHIDNWQDAERTLAVITEQVCHFLDTNVAHGTLEVSTRGKFVGTMTVITRFNGVQRLYWLDRGVRTHRLFDAEKFGSCISRGDAWSKIEAAMSNDALHCNEEDVGCVTYPQHLRILTATALALLVIGIVCSLSLFFVEVETKTLTSIPPALMAAALAIFYVVAGSASKKDLLT